jgi:hypothetical protein
MKTVAPALMLCLTFLPVSAGADQAMGPLRIHPDNPRYFTDGTGNAVWLAGSHTWANFQERGVAGRTPDFDYDAYLAFLVDRGHNFMRLWRWEHAQWMQFVPADTLIRYEPMAYQRTGPGLALDGKPKFDLTRFNPAYFKRLRDRIAAAGQRGIYVSVMMFQGFSVEQKGTKGVDSNKGNAWLGHPYNAANNINGIDGDPNHDNEGLETHTLADRQVIHLQKAYLRQVIDTLNDLDNVLWEISNESHTGSIEWHYHMIEFIKAYEAQQAQQHLIGMTSSPIDNPPLFASPAHWISPKGGNYLTSPPDAQGKKIIVCDTDHIKPWDSDPQWVWKSFMRGNHFTLMDHYTDFRLGSPKEPDPKHDPARQAMGLAVRIAKEINLAPLTPSAKVSSTRYCLANPKHQYLIYQPKPNKAFTAAIKPGRYSIEWIDCASGQHKKTAAQSFGTDLSAFKSPFKTHALLHLQRVEE